MIYKPLDEHEDTCFWKNLILFPSVEIYKSMREISSRNHRTDETYNLNYAKIPK